MSPSQALHFDKPLAGIKLLKAWNDLQSPKKHVHKNYIPPLALPLVEESKKHEPQLPRKLNTGWKARTHVGKTNQTDVDKVRTSIEFSASWGKEHADRIHIFHLACSLSPPQPNYASQTPT